MKFAFVIKVLLFSALISVTIKSLAPYVSISASSGLAISIVLTPPLVLGIVFWRRFLQSES